MKRNIKESFILSICIPIYNNANIFRHCLETIKHSINGLEEEIEIVISDNDSQDNVDEIIHEFSIINPSICVNYQKNESNKGMAFNFHKVIELARGEYCWIIGSDDFLLPDGLQNILDVIKKNPDIPFISLTFGHLSLEKIYDSNNLKDNYHNILSVILDESHKHISYGSGNKFDGLYKWDKLTSPSLKNVMFGSIMAGIFLRKKWIETCEDIEVDMLRFNSVDTVYPHIKVYSRVMVGQKAFHLSRPVIVVGEGARAWMGNNFWDGSLPVIYFKIMNEIIDEYKREGLDLFYVIYNRVNFAKTIGRYFFPYFKRAYISKKYIKNQEDISLIKAYIKVWYAPTFYIGLLKGIIREIVKGR